MKKVLMALFACAISVTAATAGVGINWSTGWGIYDHTETDLVGGSAALLNNYNALWQLIYAGTDNQIDRPEADNAGTGYVTDDDVVWVQRTIPVGGNSGGTPCEDGTTWDGWITNPTGNTTYTDLTWGTAGFVYQRIFETALLGVVQDGDWYYDSQLFSMGPGGPANGYDINTEYSGSPATPNPILLDSPTAGIQPTQQVPEPATMGLLGLGALVMSIRRRRS